MARNFVGRWAVAALKIARLLNFLAFACPRPARHISLEESNIPGGRGWRRRRLAIGAGKGRAAWALQHTSKLDDKNTTFAKSGSSSPAFRRFVRLCIDAERERDRQGRGLNTAVL